MILQKIFDNLLKSTRLPLPFNTKNNSFKKIMFLYKLILISNTSLQTLPIYQSASKYENIYILSYVTEILNLKFNPYLEE